jgi:hypothetical protein
MLSSHSAKQNAMTSDLNDSVNDKFRDLAKSCNSDVAHLHQRVKENEKITFENRQSMDSCNGDVLTIQRRLTELENFLNSREDSFTACSPPRAYSVVKENSFAGRDYLGQVPWQPQNLVPSPNDLIIDVPVLTRPSTPSPSLDKDSTISKTLSSRKPVSSKSKQLQKCKKGIKKRNHIINELNSLLSESDSHSEAEQDSDFTSSDDEIEEYFTANKQSTVKHKKHRILNYQTMTVHMRQGFF